MVIDLEDSQDAGRARCFSTMLRVSILVSRFATLGYFGLYQLLAFYCPCSFGFL